MTVAESAVALRGGECRPGQHRHRHGNIRYRRSSASPHCYLSPLDFFVFFVFFVEVVVVVVGVLVVDDLIIVSASVSAVFTSASTFAVFFAVWIAWPRLMPSSTMLVFRSVNFSPRLFETFTAATNCPRFVNPSAAFIRSVPSGRRLCSLSARFVFF